MIAESFLITVLGMGSVFFFLFLLICFMNLVALLSSGTTKNRAVKIAVALAAARRAQKGE